MIDAVAELASTGHLSSVDYPFEDISKAATSSTRPRSAKPMRRKMRTANAIKLFKLAGA